jgi:hypothetical protein
VRKLIAYLVETSWSQLRGQRQDFHLTTLRTLTVPPWEPNSREPSALHAGTQFPSVMDSRALNVLRPLANRCRG